MGECNKIPLEENLVIMDEDASIDDIVKSSCNIVKKAKSKPEVFISQMVKKCKAINSKEEKDEFKSKLKSKLVKDLGDKKASDLMAKIKC